MSFKDEARRDIERVFLNPLEFAEPHDIDGTIIQCVVDVDNIDGRSGTKGSTQWMDGVYQVTRHIYVKAESLPQKPVRGQRIRLDGEYFYIDDVNDHMGMLDITITAVES